VNPTARHGLTGSHQSRPGSRDDVRAGGRAKLGIPIESVEIVHGDTGRVPFGMGTYGSRSLSVGGTATSKPSTRWIAKGKKIAAHLLEASDTDIEFENGVFKVAGTDKSVAVRQRLAHSLRAAKLPARQSWSRA